jgi:hypothetical protein
MRFALALIVTLLATFPALASPSCMTKHEARAHYGNSWIYWHTERHCWDNQRGRVRIAKRNETDNRSAGSRRKLEPTKSPSRTAVAEDAQPSRGFHPETAVTISIWPDPPTDFTWADRWPNQDRISPDRWLLELVQFGKR